MIDSRHRGWTLLALSVLLCGVLHTPAARSEEAATASSAEAPMEPVWLQVLLNGELLGTELLLAQGGQVWVSDELLQQWRLDVPASTGWVNLPEGRFARLDDLPELGYELDPALQQLRMVAGAAAMQQTRLQAVGTTSAPVDPAALGAFLNYDLNSAYADGHSSNGCWFEAGVFGRAGYAISSFLAGDSVTSSSRLLRLDSTWVIDSPERMSSLRLGDSISASGSGSRARRFAGVQWGSDFALQPELITFPLPSASGSAVVPSTVDVYVDQILRSRQEVPAGPFELSGLPLLSGAGQTEIVVRDALGREQRLPYSFYTSTSLLRPGLRAWQYSLGLQRQDYGQASNHYRDWLFSASERFGFSERLTAEWQAEWTRQQLRSGVGASWKWAKVGVAQTSLALSQSAAGSGGMLGLGFERRAALLSYSASAQWSSHGFDAASAASERTPKLRLQSTLGWSFGAQGSLALNWLHQQRHGERAVDIAGLGYSRNLGQHAFLNLSAQRVIGPEAQWNFGLSVSVPLDGDISSNSSNSSFSSADGDATLRFDVQRGPPAGEGFGYRLRLEQADTTRIDAGLLRQGRAGILRADLSSMLGQTQWRVQGSGGLLYLGGRLLASRPLTESFARVDVADYPGVRIYADNQWVATTGADGSALIPRLRPWQHNRLRVEQADLPFDAQIESLDLDVVPPARSGVAVAFAVERRRTALLQLVLDDGSPVPAGASVVLQPAAQPLPLGLNGRVYAEHLAPEGNVLQLRWHEQLCEVPLSLPVDAAMPDLGVLVCHGVSR